MDNKTISKVIPIIKKAVEKLKPPIVTYVANQHTSPFKGLIITVISLRTKDEVTGKAGERLFKLADTPETMSKLSTKQIEKAIYPAGFYKVKASNIKKISEILIKYFNSKVPDDLDTLLTLPNVGRKTANLVLIEGFKKLAMCVDIHVHRISNRIGYVKTKTPEETEFALRDKLPKKYWLEYNWILVAFGQTICKPVSPFCSKCPIEKYCKRINITKSR